MTKLFLLTLKRGFINEKPSISRQSYTDRNALEYDLSGYLRDPNLRELKIKITRVEENKVEETVSRFLSEFL